MTRTLTLESGAELIAQTARAGNGRVLLPGGAMEALALQCAFAARPELADGLVFTGLPVPGVNRFDWASLHPGAAMEVCIPSADWATTLADGRCRLYGLHYSAFFARLVAEPAAVQVLHLTRPDASGWYTMGWSGDIPPGLGRLTVGLINEALPPVLGAQRVASANLDIVINVAHAPVLASASADGPDALVNHMAGLVDDGSTIQIGIGRLPGAILAALAHKKRLNIHSGLVGQELAPLLASGALDPVGLIRAGLVLGDQAFLDQMAEEPRLKLVPVSVSHGHASLSAIPRLVSINAALEADLTGQINCEWAGTRRIAGIGGALDFLRGARASAGGRAITAIQAEGTRGESRIVARLTSPTISIPRADTDTIVSEFGIAALRHAPEAERAALMSALAPPAARASLLPKTDR